METSIFEVVIIVLATYRLASDFANELGFFGAYAKIRNGVKRFVENRVDKTDLELKDHPLYWLHDGIDCFICLSFWCAFVVYWLPEFILIPIACAGLAKLIHDFAKRFIQ